MSIKTYDVTSPRIGSISGGRNDKSFSSCLCTMLVILAICSMLLLLSFFVGKMSSKKDNQYESNKFERIVRNHTTTERYDKTIESRKEETTRKIIATTETESDTIPTAYETSTLTTELLSERTIDTTVGIFPVSKNEEVTHEVKTETTTNQESTDRTTDQSATTHSERTPRTLLNGESTQNPTTPTETTTLYFTDTDEGTNGESTKSTVTNRQFFTAQTTTESSHEQSTEAISTTDESFVNVGGFSQTTTEVIQTTQEIIVSSTDATTENNDQYVTELSTRYEVSQTTIDDTSEPSTTFDESDYVESSTTQNENSKEKYEDFSSLNFKDKDTCTSRRCNLIAARIISSMDPSEKPCNNFFNYACGGILDNEREEVDIFQPELFEGGSPNFLRTFNKFYQSCKNYEDTFQYEDRITALLNILQTHLHDNDDQYRLDKLLANLILLEAFPYLDIHVEVNPKNSSLFILSFRKPQYKPPSSQYLSSFSEVRRKCLRKASENLNASSFDEMELYNKYRNCHMNYTDYLETVESLRMEKNRHMNLNQTNEKIRKSVANLSHSLVLLDESINNPHFLFESMMKIGELQKDYPILNWTIFLSQLIGKNVDEESDIQIDNKAHFDLFIRSIRMIDKGALLNVLESIAEYSIYENIVLQSHLESRTEFCNQQTKYLMPDIANYLYKIIPNAKLEEQSEYILKIFDHFKNQFNKSLEDSTWIDDQSRNKMIHKLERIKLSLFTLEDHSEEQNFLEKIYTEQIEEKDYPSNLISLTKLKNKQKLSLHGQAVTNAKIHRYLLAAAEELPLYIDSNTKAYIPYGLIQKASKELPDYLVMAQVGFPLSKIIGKAFSPTIMKKEMIVNTETIAQYSHFVNRMMYDESLSKPFNHQSSLFEGSRKLYVDNIVAENTALRLLTDRKETFGIQSLLPWISYQFSREKIFFLILTQEFCRKKDEMDVVIEYFQNDVLPSPLRTNNILSHSEEFLKHFSCDNSSPMFRSEKLQFPYIEKNFDMEMLT